MRATTKPVTGDLVFTRADVLVPGGHVPAGTVGHVTRLDGATVEVDCGPDYPAIALHRSFVEVLELPDGVREEYLGSTLAELVLWLADELSDTRRALATMTRRVTQPGYKNGNGRN